MLQALTDQVDGNPPTVRAVLDPQAGCCCVILTRRFDVEPRRNRTGDPILTIDARVVHNAVQHLIYPYNRTGGRSCRGSGRGAG
jgi:hypothetical protein